MIGQMIRLSIVIILSLINTFFLDVLFTKIQDGRLKGNKYIKATKVLCLIGCNICLLCLEIDLVYYISSIIK